MNTENTRKNSHIITTAYFDRSVETIEGTFTIKTVTYNNTNTVANIYEIAKLPARSGQNGYTHNSWHRGKSPVPFGDWLLWLDPINQGLDVAKDPKGIGAFYQISSSADNKRLIKDTWSPYERWDIGLHEENDKPGSAGCIVLVNQTKEQKEKIHELYAYLKHLAASCPYPFIRLRVL